MSDAAVGSISHILKTAFKDVYQDFSKREQAQKAREDLIIAAEEARKKKEAEDLAAAEAAAAEAAAASKSRKGPPKKDEKKKEPVVDVVAETEAPVAVTVDPSNLIENYYASIEKFHLDQQYRDMLDTKTVQIKETNEDKVKHASDLSTYLTAQRETARHLEELEEEELKRRGIMLGQHIPSLPTKLDIQKSKISGHDNFSNNIVVANELVENNRELFLRRTGNLPITDLAAQRLLERSSKTQMTLDPKEPHYVTTTGNNAVRVAGIHKRFEITLKTAEEERQRKEKDKEPRKKFPVRNDLLTPAQAIENARIQKEMTHKQNYLRNPRNNPKSIEKMLTKAVGDKTKEESANSPDAHSVASSITNQSQSTRSYKKQPVVLNNPLFVAEPKSIEFNGYEIGVPVSKIVYFRNVSSISRSIRIWPAQSSIFSMSPIQYPANCKGGFIAPGMSVSTVVTFVPDSLGDNFDFIRVETEGGGFKVAISAQRELPILNIPKTIDVGVCLVGDASRAVLKVTNTGGAGKFRLLHPSNYPLVPVDLDWEHIGCVRVTPFTLYPVEFTLARNQTVDVTIEYVPRTLGNHDNKVYLLCDNSQVQEITVQGSSRQVDVSIVEVNQVPFTDSNPLIRRQLMFDGTYIGAEAMQQFVVCNNTGMAIEYEWVWMPMNCNNIRKVALDKIAAREENDAIMAQSFIDRDFNNKSIPPFGELPVTPYVNINNELPVPPSRNTIEKLIDSIDGESNALRNEAIDGEYTISPARGILPADEVGIAFDIAFNPKDLVLTSRRAVLMLKNTPKSALPGIKGQEEALRKLEMFGHGEFHRLRSWLEEVGEVATVPQYIKPNGDPSTTGKITSMQTILDMVTNHAKPAMQPQDRIRIELWTRQIVLHIYACENRMLQIDEDEDAAADIGDSFATDSTSGKTKFVMYNWTCGSDVDPAPLYPMKLSILNISDKRDDGRSPEEWEVEDNLIEANKHHLQTLWVDCWTGLKFLERTVCQILDDRVRHEAVDYIKECAQATIVCLDATVSGRGQSQILDISPPSQFVPGKLSIGQLWVGKIEIHNPSAAMAEVEVVSDEIEILPLAMDAFNTFYAANSLDSSNYIQRKRFDIELQPSTVTLLPESSASVDVCLSAWQAGRFEIKIPFRSRNSFTIIDMATVIVNVIGPRLHFAASEVDVGLVGVGATEERVLTVSNEGDVPCKFLIKSNLVDVFATMAKGTMLDSRMNSARSNKSDGSGSRDSFMIEAPTATVVIEPPAGIIEAGKSMALVIKCKAGSMPQRIRGNLECSLFDGSGQMRLPSQYLSIRGEVQVPKTKMYPMTFDLGKIFVSIPVYFDVYLENMCNLPTKFKFERPGGDSSQYKMTIDKMKGSLDQKEIIKIRVEIIALTVGVIDDVVACKCFGVKTPLGFSINAVAAGIKLEFAPVVDGFPVVKPLASPTDNQFPGKGNPPDPIKTVPLCLGRAVELYERRKMRFTIRNLSPIATNFNFTVSKFIVKNLAPAMVTSSVSISEDGSLVEESGDRKDLILAPHEDGTDKFKSAAGKKYIDMMLQRRADKIYLKSGLGASYLIEPAVGHLAPWGVQVVTVKSFNDMPGCYDDECFCNVVDGNGVMRESVIPIQQTILGCPLIIEKDTIGMSKVYENHGPVEDVNKPLLIMGHTCVHSDPLVRTFVVRNNGSKPGKLKWKLRQSNMVMNGPLRIKLAVNESGKVKTNIKFWSDLAHETAFTIEPDKCVIQPYCRQSFTVTLLRTELVGKITGSLTGVIGFEESAPSRTVSKDTLTPSSSTGSVEKSTSSSSSGSNYNLVLLVEGHIAHPAVSIDKRVFEVPDNPTEPADFAIKLKTQAPLLYASGSKPSEICRKPMTIINPLDANLMFSIITEGPFTIKSAASNPGGCDDNASIAGSVASSIRSGHSAHILPVQQPTSSIGKPFYLLPNASASFSLAFTPRRELRETLTRIESSAAGSAKQEEQKGALIFTFATGQSLRLPLVVQISTPFIVTSSPRLFFGVCHVVKSCQGTLLLSNPTNVTANWSVMHIPGAGAVAKKTAIRVAGFKEPPVELDDPTVFVITPTEGTLLGPTVSVTAAVAAPPKDLNRHAEDAVVVERLMQSSWATNTLSLADSVSKRQTGHVNRGADACYPAPIILKFCPKKNCRYSSRFRFICEFGNSFDVLLVGQGTFEEHEHNPLSPTPGH